MNRAVHLALARDGQDLRLRVDNDLEMKRLQVQIMPAQQQGSIDTRSGPLALARDGRDLGLRVEHRLWSIKNEELISFVCSGKVSAS